MASLRKAIKTAWLGKRYAVIEGKENDGYAETPMSKRTAKSAPAPLSERNTMNQRERPMLRRNSSVTQSVRDVMGTMRQKLKKSTRQRKRLQTGGTSPGTPGLKKEKTQKRTPTRRGGYREVKMYSPFGIESPRKPNRIRTRPPRWHDVETPTRLRKEVEDLTSNMQALVNLTPGTLQARSHSRRSLKSSPLTNGSLRSPATRRTPMRQVRRSLQTTIL